MNGCTTCRLLFSALLITISSTLFGLPINFGVNQIDLEYDELTSENFEIFFDRRFPQEAAIGINALEAAKPLLEKWLGTARTSPLPVIMSSTTANASFANFVTDVLEIQSLGEANRELFWHEYVHNLMYQHMWNWFGPAGATFHLPWLPAWFIEGLAEAISVSVGSAKQASIERYQALTGKWPSYDRLHSLYRSGSFQTVGYATSGAFVSWLLQKQQPGQSLPRLLEEFYWNTWPHYYIFSFNPFSSFLPMDDALKEFSGLTGKEGYAQYKEDVTRYWQSQRGDIFLGDGGVATGLNFSTPWPLQMNSQRIVLSAVHNGEKHISMVTFDADTGWAKGIVASPHKIPDDISSWHILARDRLRVGIRVSRDFKSGVPVRALATWDDRLKTKDLVPINGHVRSLMETDRYIVWLEQLGDRGQLCSIEKDKIWQEDLQSACFNETDMPESLEFIGHEYHQVPGDMFGPGTDGKMSVVKNLWLAARTQTLVGDRYRLKKIELTSLPANTQDFAIEVDGAPKSIAATGSDLWVLFEGANRTVIRRLDNEGRCHAQINFDDYVDEIVKTQDDRLAIRLLHGSHYKLIKVDPYSLPKRRCESIGHHVSPLIAGLASKGQASLAESLQQANLRQNFAAGAAIQGNALESAIPLDQAPPPTGGFAKSASRSISAGWHPRPVLGFPFIGGDDPLGYNYGFISVPLMDKMQNETLRLQALFGLKSKFPNVELALTSTRFWPTITFSGFKQLVWDLGLQDRRLFNSWVDEVGGRISASWNLHFFRSRLTLTPSLKIANRKFFYGTQRGIIEGMQVRPGLGISYTHSLNLWRLKSFSTSVSMKTTPALLNQNFDYHQLRGSVGLGFSMPWRSILQLAVSGGLTDGTPGKTPILRNYYYPLKTFVPGSGGGYNQNSFDLLGDYIGRGTLFSPRFGDRDVRYEANWTSPIISDVDKMLWILYFERLDFSVFVNYGTAWWDGAKPSYSLAHGYNLDLQFENKGVGFNAGIGTGQVIGSQWQVYVKFGFDALF